MDIKHFKKYIEKKKKDYLIFDFDETIVWLKMDWTDWHEAMFQLFRRFDNNSKNYKGSAIDIINGYVKKYGEALRKEVVEINRQYEKEYTEKVIPNKDLIEYIRNIEDKKMSIFSSNDSRNIKEILKNLKLEKKFEKIIGRNDVTYVKSDPEGILKIIDGQDKKRFVMIGDSRNDKKAAKAAGIDFYKIDIFK